MVHVKMSVIRNKEKVIRNSTISGPLNVKYYGQMFIENCFTITHKHVNNIHERIKFFLK